MTMYELHLPGGWDEVPLPSMPSSAVSPVSRSRRPACDAASPDERWGWPWMLDVLRVVRPRYVLVENVRRLVTDTDAFGTILADLHQLGFDAQWSLVSACAFGAPHTRERLFLVAYPESNDGEQSLHLPTSVEAGRAFVGAAGGQAWSDGWLPEPPVSRVAHGLPKWMVAPALRAIGNAVVPVVAEHVGRLIAAHALAAAP